jgi:PAS domain S-box-containing protein
MDWPSEKNNAMRVAIIAMVFILGFGGIFSYSLYKSRQDANINAAKRAQTMAKLLAFRISGLSESTKLWLDELERHIDARALASDATPDEVTLLELDKWVNDIKRQNFEIGNLGFLDFQGRAFLLRSAKRGNVSLADTSYWKQIKKNGAAGRGQIFLSEPYVFKTTGKLGIVFARGIYSDDGQVLGGVVAGVHIDQLSQMLQLADIGKYGVATLFDAKLRLMGRWPKLDNMDGRLQLNPMRQTGPVDDTYYVVSDIDHIERLHGVARIQGLPLTVTVGLAPADYLVAWNEYARNIGIACVILMGLTVVVARFWLRSMHLSREMTHTLLLLRSSEERWKFAFEGSGDGVWDWDISHGEILLSDRSKEMLGYQPEETVPDLNQWPCHLHQDDISVVNEKIQSNLNGLTSGFFVEHRMQCKDGSYLWILDRGKVVQRDVEGKPLRMIGMLTDISQRKQLDRMKSEFISTVSHELRTPITSIRGALSLLEAGVLGELPAKALGMVKIAHKNSQRLITLVNDILDMDKLLSGKMQVKAEPVDMSDLVEQAIAANAEYAASCKVAFVNVPPSVKCIAIGDANRLMQVLANLMSNAAKFSYPESIVEIRVLEANDTIRVEVEDKGVGIPAEFQSRIFEEFSQADNANTRQYQGTGLGLNISKKMVEKMHGNIGYVTEPNVGTTFWFTIPKA